MAPYRLVLRAFLATLPVTLFVSLAESFLQRSGEVTPVEKVAAMNYRGGAPGAYMRMLIDQQTYRYRYEQVRRFRPGFLVVGSSRVQRVRREMFDPAEDFYNASGVVAGPADLEAFIGALPADYAPRTLLIGIDSWWFNGERDDPPPGVSFREDIREDDATAVNAHLYAYQELVARAWEGSLSRELLKKVILGDDGGIRRYGLGAWMSTGYRNDGSNQPFDRSNPGRYVDRENPPVVERVLQGTLQFVPTDRVDDARLKKFEEALGVLAARGTRIAGFAPPFSSEVLSAVHQDRRQAAFLTDFRLKMEALFRENGWCFFDATELSRLGLDDRSMEDGFHAMETFHAALFLKMAEDEDTRAVLGVDRERLTSMLANPGTTAWHLMCE